MSQLSHRFCGTPVTQARDVRFWHGVLLSYVSGFLFCIVCRGADQYLTTSPRAFTLASGGLLLVASLQLSTESVASRKRLALSMLAGIGAAFVLPLAFPDAAGEVITAPLVHGYSGDLFRALDRIDQDPAAMLNTKLSVSGDWTPATADRAATVSRRIMACCAADSIAVGFDVYGDEVYPMVRRSAVMVSGILRARVVDGEIRYALTHAHIRSQR